MAWIFGDGFDFYSTIADAGTFWDSDSGASLTSTTRFSVGSAIQIPNQSFTGVVVLGKSSPTNDVTHHICFARKNNNVLSGTTLGDCFQLLDGINAQCTVAFRSDGAIIVMSGGYNGTVIATFTGAFADAVWVQYEFEITINNTTGAVHVRKNGNTVDDFVATGINTRGGSTNAYANHLTIGQNSPQNNNAIWDDFLWFSATGAAPNTWVGDVRCVQLMPTADTAQKQFTPNSGTSNFSRVNEAQEDGDTSYVSDVVAGHNDLYDIADLATTPASVVAVQTKGFVKKSDAGARSAQVQLKSGSSTVTSAAAVLPTTYQYISRIDTVDPNTSAAWTGTAINAIQIGPVVQA